MTAPIDLPPGASSTSFADATADQLADRTIAALSSYSVATSPCLSRADLVALACQLYESRRLRSRFLSQSLLGEPVWDMLLALYCFPPRGEKISISGLCQAAAVPSTTALRWLQLLEQKDLVCRIKDHQDARRSWVALTEPAETMMSNYLTAVTRRG